MTKPKRPPTTREFNAAILDKVIEQAMPADQREEEFTAIDMVARGMTEATARRFCVSEWKRGALSRRVGMSRLTHRRTWLYKLKESKG